MNFSRISYDGMDCESLTTDQLPDVAKNYYLKIRDLNKQLFSAEMSLLDEKEITTYLEIIIIYLRENRQIPGGLWTLAIKEENINGTKSGSPRLMRRRTSFSHNKDEESNEKIHPGITLPVGNIPSGSPRTQLLHTLQGNEELSTEGLTNLQILDIIRDSLTRKSLRMTTLQNSIYDLRERIQDEERKSVRIKSKMEKLGLTPRR